MIGTHAVTKGYEMKSIAAMLMVAAVATDDYTVEYTATTEGPRTTHEGTIAFHRVPGVPTEPCLYHEFEVDPEDRVAGPVISGTPGEPLLAFDRVWDTNSAIAIEWCEFTSGYQSVPYSIPRNFVFYTFKTSFGASDLEKLLSDWGLEDSPWDLDVDGVVGGQDLALLLAGWKSQ